MQKKLSSIGSGFFESDIPVYMSLLLYVHLQNDVFPILFLSPLYWGNTLSLTNVITYPHCFLTACKKLWRLWVSAGTLESKNPDLYY